MHKNRKYYLYLAGNLLALIGLAVIGWKLWKWRGELSLELSLSLAAHLMAIALLYTFAGFILSVAWRNNLIHGGGNLPLHQAIKLYGTSQLAKYVPGNIIQFIARQAMGRAMNLPHKILALATFWELALIALVSGSFIFPLLSNATLMRILPFSDRWCAFFTPALGWGLLTATVVALYWFLRRRFSKYLAASLLCYYGYTAIMGVTFVLVLLLLDASVITSGTCGLFFCLAIIAYLVGFAVPGAPSGIGIREGFLLFFLQGPLTEQTVLMAALLWRVVSIGGDVFFYLITKLRFR